MSIDARGGDPGCRDEEDVIDFFGGDPSLQAYIAYRLLGEVNAFPEEGKVFLGKTMVSFKPVYIDGKVALPDGRILKDGKEPVQINVRLGEKPPGELTYQIL